MRTPCCHQNGMRGQGKDEDTGRKRLFSAAGMCAVSAALTEKGHRAAEAKVKSWRETRGTAEPGEGGGGNRKEEREPSKPAAGAGAPSNVAPPCLEGPGRRRLRQSPGPRPMPTLVWRGRLLQLLPHPQSPAADTARPNAGCARGKEVRTFRRRVAALGTGKR